MLLLCSTTDKDEADAAAVCKELGIDFKRVRKLASCFLLLANYSCFSCVCVFAPFGIVLVVCCRFSIVSVFVDNRNVIFRRCLFDCVVWGSVNVIVVAVLLVSLSLDDSLFV